MFHKMWVNLTTADWLLMDLGKKRGPYYGIYNENTKSVYLDRDLDFEVKRHALYHELAHHILYALDEIADEENKCDALGKYLVELVDAKELTDQGLKSSGKKS